MTQKTIQDFDFNQLMTHWYYSFLVKWKHFLKCNVSMSQKLPYGTKILYKKFELDLWGGMIRAKSLKFWKYCRGHFFQFSLILGSARFARMRGFQIWSQNWNRTIFDPLLDQNTVEVWHIWLFCQFLTVFDSFFGKKWVKFYPVSVLRPDLKSSNPGGPFLPKNER